MTDKLDLYDTDNAYHSRMGELFDHGVDACNTALEVLLFAGANNMGQGWKTVSTLFCCTSLAAKYQLACA